MDIFEYRYEKKNITISKWICGLVYLLSIVVGNMLVAYFGIITFMGLTFPCGAIAIGITFSARDFVQRLWGDVKVWYFMITSTFITTILGVILSNLPIPTWKIAIASAVSFIISEAIDWGIYWLTKRSIEFRIIVSNLVSIPIDSILFVGITFGTFNFLEPIVYGQAIVKYLSGLIVLPFLIYFRYNNLKKQTTSRKSNHIFPNLVE